MPTSRIRWNTRWPRFSREPVIPPDPDASLALWRARLNCGFPGVQAVFADCLREAQAVLSADALEAYVDQAHALSRLGRGPEPVLNFLQEWPQVVLAVGHEVLPDVQALIARMQRSPNGRALAPLLATLAAVARTLRGADPLRHYLGVVDDMMQRTTVSIHGHHATIESAGLHDLLQQAPRVLDSLTVAGMARWSDYGVRHYRHHPEHQRDYFGLRSADSLAVLQRERHGTLLTKCERTLELTLRSLWQDDSAIVAYGTGFAAGTHPGAVHQPYWDEYAMRLPDVYDAAHGLSGLQRYQVALAHMAAHRRWSTPQWADNLSPLQRLSVECLEDARVDHLLLRQYPGLRPLVLALLPVPVAGDCDPRTLSCLRHRLAMLSRALLDDQHGYADPALLETVARFHALLAQGESSTSAMRELALQHAARTRRQSDQFAHVYFKDTVVSYRDDNRALWRFVEAGDEEESFPEERRAPESPATTGLPPRHYPEWDAATQSYRPDWVTLYEALHPSGVASTIDTLLQRHQTTARQLQRLLDQLKPQDRQRLRFQEEGSELDLDVAIGSLIDWRAGCQPEPRILMHHEPRSRSIAVMLLLDLSASLNDPIGPNSAQTRLQVSQEAVALLAWAVHQVGDPFAIAGFHSNTRHEVRYQHILGFSEGWGDAAKARLAALRADYSTRMGAALRHAAHYLGAQTADKKLLLVLTDGAPADVDVTDPEALVADSHQAVQELAQQGILCHCISLDPQADAYVHRIFAQHATVVDHADQLPQRLTRLFVGLTS